MDQGPERDYTPDEDGGVVHYGPGDRPLCGTASMTAVYTDDPARVAGCRDCLELVYATTEYRAIACTAGWITVQGGVEWRPSGGPARTGGRMVKTSKDADARRTILTTAVFAGCYPTEVNVGA